MRTGATRAAFGVLLLSALSALPSCGKGAEETCNDFITEICAKKVPACVPPSILTEAACRQQVMEVNPCSRAVSVTSSYDDCITELNTSSCATLFPNNMLVVPPDCVGVIQIE
jgi:hypothetical protein